MRCSNCGSDSSAGKKFCGDCGAPLTTHCPKCDAGNPPGKRFCGDCGGPLDATAAPGLKINRALIHESQRTTPKMTLTLVLNGLFKSRQSWGLITPNNPAPYSCTSSVALTGEGPAEKKRWLRGPFRSSPRPNSRPHSPRTENGDPFVRLSVPASWPVSGLKAWISPSSTLPTKSRLLSGPKLCGARAMPQGAARIGEVSLPSRLLANSLVHVGLWCRFGGHTRPECRRRPRG